MPDVTTGTTPKPEPTLYDLRKAMVERGNKKIEELSKPPDVTGAEDKGATAPPETPAPETPDPKVGAGEAEQAQPKQPYTAEEFETLSKDPEFLKKLEMERVDSEDLQKKIRSANEFFDRRAKELKQHENSMIEKETALQGTLGKANELVQKLQAQNEKYKEEFGEMPEADPKDKEEAEKLRVLTWNQREMAATMQCQSNFKDWGEFSKERMQVVEDFPILRELANERDGYYLPVVAEAMHRLAREKKENFEARVEREVQARVGKLVEGAKKAYATKTAGVSRVAHADPPPKEPPTKPKDEKPSGDFGDSYRERMHRMVKEHKGG